MLSSIPNHCEQGHEVCLVPLRNRAGRFGKQFVSVFIYSFKSKADTVSTEYRLTS